MIISSCFLFFSLWWGTLIGSLGYYLVREDPLRILAPCFFSSQSIFRIRLPLLSYGYACKNYSLCHQCSPYRSINHLFTELFTAIILATLYFKFNSTYFMGYALFSSALLVTIRSDAETFFISRYVTLFLVPVIWLFSFCHLLPVSPFDSIVGAFFGYGILQITRAIFYRITHQEGLGQGDSDLLAFIGAATGIIGAWFSLFVGALLGSCAGGLYILFVSRQRHLVIPFGPFLALGALLYIFVQEPVKQFFFLC